MAGRKAKKQRLCTCGHRWGAHGTPDDPLGGCVVAGCGCPDYKSTRAEIRRRADYAPGCSPDSNEHENNPGDDMYYGMTPYGESSLGTYALPSPNPTQTYWGAGAGHYDGDTWHPGGGRYLSPRHLGRPPYDYHPGGGHRSHGDQFFPGAGYNANPYGESPLGTYALPDSNPRTSLPCARCGRWSCSCGCAGDLSICTCRARSYKWNPYGPSGYAEAFDYNPDENEDEDEDYLAGSMRALADYELNPPRMHWGAGGGYHNRRGQWRPGGGRQLQIRHLGRPPYDYHPGGGQYNRGFHPGSGYNANPFACPTCGR